VEIVTSYEGTDKDVLPQDSDTVIFLENAFSILAFRDLPPSCVDPVHSPTHLSNHLNLNWSP
jgi:hypothetical protein